ncbi:MAG: hypothetical protein WDW36_008767 [Sanguina aurantia]
MPGRPSTLLPQLHMYTTNAEQEATNSAAAKAAATGPPLGIVGLARSQAKAKPDPKRLRVGNALRMFLPISGSIVLLYAYLSPDTDDVFKAHYPPEFRYLQSQDTANTETVTNWSATHEATPARFFQAETEAEVQQFVTAANNMSQKLRVVGSALSPNGLGLSDEGMLSMALLDKVISIDAEKMQITVLAGARVQQVVEALKPHNLTLQNFASIREQQIGGYTQIGAHGTGAALPSVDEHVVAMTLATPGLGVLQLSTDEEPELFRMARVGLGGLGVVTRVTLQAVPREQLLETTFTASAAEVKKNHVKWLSENRHLRYMWLPYTDTVVVVQANPLGSTSGGGSPTSSGGGSSPAAAAALTEEQKLAPMADLYRAKLSSDPAGLSFSGLRDALLAVDPLNQPWVVSVNKAESEFWKRSAGTRQGYSDEILGFDCGGQQWVLEAAVPVGELASLKGKTKDIEFMEALLKEIETGKIPAPSPIEQRWSSGSSSPMSPSSGAPGHVTSWVGIIMYLPDEAVSRAKVTAA